MKSVIFARRVLLSLTVVLAWLVAGCGRPADASTKQNHPSGPPGAAGTHAVPITAGVYYIASRQPGAGRLTVGRNQLGPSGEVICAPAEPSNAQRWYIATDPAQPGRYTITSDAGRNRFIQPQADVGPLPVASGGSGGTDLGINDPGRPIWYYPRWDTPYQSWQLTRASGGDDVYTIANDGSALVLELKDYVSGKVCQQMASGSANQQWTLQRIH